MHLYARDRIAVKCKEGCSVNKEFHFTTSANALFATMTTAWDNLQILCYVAGVGTGVSLLVFLYVIFLKSRAT
jgi:hypothetical protein